ncbi:MAG TPA: CCA tRNA nucleotidyltransferase [Planctomycetes bacterium]|nr:CCA tRNA nucleotidyltransferase [Planctomycetaceae bacterium]HIN53731.1 CCA tRNA nucleotidyltransferase [Planctomycetota bacterium]
MTESSPIVVEKARLFAVKTVRKLRKAGFIAYFAGGCVRDQEMRPPQDPHDYDIATNALPDQIQEVFTKKKTLAIGAAFGVITLIGTRATGNIEIATFREDTAYSDGRHPDGVSFCNAEQDALRRDFTINGMFYDPIDEQVIDFVNGRADIVAKVIRAIGIPAERFQEDKLRILRAIRLATTLKFTIHAETLAAVNQFAENLQQVSRERILVELKRTLDSDNYQRGLELLLDTGALTYAVPGLTLPESSQAANWQSLLAITAAMPANDFLSTLALIFKTLVPDAILIDVRASLKQMKMSNDDIRTVCWMVDHVDQFINANSAPWPQIQRLLIDPHAVNTLAIATAWSNHHQQSTAGIEFCQQKLDLPLEQLDPAPLLDGKDLQEMGLHPGPLFSKVLTAVRDAQLTGETTTKPDAAVLAQAVFQQLSDALE